VIRDIANNPSTRLFGDTALRNSEEPNVEIIKIVFCDSPFFQPSLVGFEKAFLLLRAHTCEAVIGWITEDDKNGSVALDVFGSVAFFLEFGEEKPLLGFLGRLPPCEGIGQEDTDTLAAFFRKGRSKVLEKQTYL
jgi:hypothetical protein